MKRQARALLFLTAFFALSRAVIYAVRPFYYAPIQFYMQYLDPEVLRHDLLHGVWNLHSQPPLFNLFLGLVLKSSPAGWAPHVFAALYFGMSLATVLCLYAVMRRLGMRAGLALAGAGLYALLPSVIQAERWLFYACPVTFLLTSSVYALCRFAREKRVAWYAALAGLCLATVLTRSFFHPLLWLAPVLGGALFVVKRERRRLLVCAALALGTLLIGLVPSMVNARKYGMFTASTWQGMSLAKMTRYVPADAVENLIASGAVTPLARIPCFSEPRVYLDYYGPEPKTGVAVLDSPVKSNGEPNWNQLVYVRASREYQQNTLRILKRHPAAYLKAVVNEIYLFFGLRSHLYFDDPHGWIDRSGRAAWHSPKQAVILFVAPVGYLLLFAGAIIGLVVQLRNAWVVGPDSDRDLSAPVPVGTGPYIYMLFLMFYAFGLAGLFELGEGCYMRMPIEPVMVAGCVLLVGRRISSSECMDTAKGGESGTFVKESQLPCS